MKAFHSDEKIKQKYLERVLRHQKEDHLIRGQGWDGTRGCAIGCTLEQYNHKAYEEELGIPEWLARVEDLLFEQMSFGKSKTLPELFLRSINVGADLNKVKGKFLVVVIKSTLDKFDHEKFPAVKKCIEDVIDLHERNEQDLNKFAWAEAAARAARAAAEAAEAAARAARAAAARAARARANTYDYFADQLLLILHLEEGGEE